ncbi:unnamed protein product, partial [Discosporangium mesarthrocarpum]
MTIELKKEWRCFGGRVLQYNHDSTSTKTRMRFTVFLPPQASTESPVPGIYYLSGLTCTDENFIQKGGALKPAAERGVALIVPDTSPRGAGVPGEVSGNLDDDNWDFGSGAGFYVNATEPQWKENYNMYTYVTEELPSIINFNFPVNTSCCSIFGHSMGGHGALTIAFRDPQKYRSVSAFSPICNPIGCPWGVKAFTGYFGTDKAKW